MRRVRGVLTVEDEQTGDGRVIAPGVTTWIDPPMPLAWLADGDQHVDLIEVAPTVGTIDSITRVGNEIQFTGNVDDEQEDGAEVVRRMAAGTATHGSRFGVSIDPDDWAVEIIATDVEEDEGGVIIMASGAGPLPLRAALIASVRAAAGDPDPGDGGGDGVILFADDSGAIIERYTRLRIRGATLCAVPAFAGAYVELDEADVVQAEPVAPDDDAAEAAVAAASPSAMFAAVLVRGLFPEHPPAEWYEPVTTEPDGSINLVASGSDAGRGHGYIAAWGTCHTGYPDRCVTPPREVDYEPFHTGSVELDSGELRACAVLTWGIPHASLTHSMVAAQDHYAHSDAMFARVAVGANEHGIWWAGGLRASITRDDVSDLRALSLSGDWRWSQTSQGLRMIAATAVNYPGFPVPRRSALAAAARIPTMDQLVASVQFDGERITAMTSAGVLAPVGAEHHDCGCGGSGIAASSADAATLAQMARTLRALDLRTRHLVPAAVTAAAERVRAAVS